MNIIFTCLSSGAAIAAMGAFVIATHFHGLPRRVLR